MAPGAVMLDVGGLALTADEENLLTHPQVGGVILFSRNYRDLEQLLALVAAIRQRRPEILIAVDHEGGRVQRFRQGFARIPPMQSFLADYRSAPAQTLERVKDTGWLMASEVLACGIDISFAPVLDADDHRCAVIADRAFSPDPEEVSVLAGAFIAGMHEAGMAVTGKHFPGHGAVVGDSHLVQPVDERSYAEVAAHDLKPFRQLARQLDAIMPAHIVFPQVDPQPVGFSVRWLQDILRAELGFDGIIFSDDLSMAGAESAGTYSQRADAALAAGCDMVLVCNNRTAALEVIEHLQARAVAPVSRLSRMRMRRQLHWYDLRQSSRWQHLAAPLVDA